MVSVSPLFRGCLCSPPRLQCTYAAVYFNTCPPKFLDSVRNWKIKQIKALASIFASSLPCNQSPRVQPSAQREAGGETYLHGGGLLPSASDPGWRKRREEGRKREWEHPHKYTLHKQNLQSYLYCSSYKNHWVSTLCNYRVTQLLGGGCFLSFCLVNYREKMETGKTSILHTCWMQKH